MSITKANFHSSTEFRILILEEMLSNRMQKVYTAIFVYKHEVIKMKELKSWPFETLGDDVEPLEEEGPGAGPGLPC